MYATMVIWLLMSTVSELRFFVVISRNVSPSALDACGKDNKTVFGFFFFKSFVSVAYESLLVSNCVEKKIKSRDNAILKGVITRKNALERGVEMRYYAFMHKKA